MFALEKAHAVTSCAHEVVGDGGPWVAAAPGAGNKVRKTKRSSRHGILTPINLLNRLSNPKAQAVVTTNDMLIEIRATTYRSSQQKDSGGSGGGEGATFV
jgi:hypothetical protein